MIARALPPLGKYKDAIDASVIGLKANMEEPVSGVLPSSFDDVLAKVTRRVVKPPLGLASGDRIPFSSGGCIGHTRKSGGFTNWCSKQAVATRSSRKGKQLRDRNVIMNPAVPLEPYEDMSSEALVICEQGGKYRPLTKSTGTVLYHGHRDRQISFPRLKGWRSTGRPLLEQKLFFDVPDDGTPRRLISGDLSNATDLVSYDTITRTCRALGINPDLVKSHKFSYKLK
jgi:hypothetical protein